MTPSELLDETANVLELFGWTQKIYGDVEEGFCTIGAMRSVVRNRCWIAPEDTTAARDLLRITISFPPDETNWADTHWFGYSNSSGIIRWNDSPERTKEQVLATLRKAAALGRLSQAIPVEPEPELVGV